VIEERLDPSTKLLVLDAVNTLCPAAGASEDTAIWNALQTWLLKLRRRGFSVLLIRHDDSGGRRRDTLQDIDVLDQIFLLKQPQATQTSEETRFEVHLGRGRQVWGDLAEPYKARLSELVGRAVWTRRSLWAAEPRKENPDRVLAGTTVRSISIETPSTIHDGPPRDSMDAGVES
jgi:hypothetical protein